MALLDDLNRLHTERRRAGGPGCGTARVLAQLPEDEAVALAQLIDGTDVFSTQIAEILNGHGYQVTAGQIAHHRRRVRGAGCTCPLPDEVE